MTDANTSPEQGRPADEGVSDAEARFKAACDYADTSTDPLASMLRKADRDLQAGDLTGAGINLHAARLGQATEALRLSALPSQAPGEGVWRPIAEAPRDGSRFLACGGGCDAVETCSYNECVGAWDCESATLSDTEFEPEGYNRPAYWTPLPPPPYPEAGA